MALLSWSFFEVAEVAFGTDLARSLDLQIANAVHHKASPLDIGIFAAITDLGGSPFQVALGMLVGIGLWVAQQRGLFVAWAFGVLGGSLLSSLLKATYQRQRPIFDLPAMVSTSYSFPSGHALNSVVMYGLLTYLTFLLAPYRYRCLTVIGAMLLTTVIGFSRIVLGVHYFTDVVAGW